MRVLVSSLEFKGTLTATEATAALAEGVRAALRRAEIIEKPMADGGPGTLDALLNAFGGNERVAAVHGPLGQTVEARWALLPDGDALIETSQAIGLTLVPPDHRNVLAATSFGAGQLIRAALDAGARRLFIGLGGSGTNDGGRGLLEALGIGFDDKSGRVDVSGLDRRLAESELLALLDVRNPLLGRDGATRVYGPQKGASNGQLDTLEARMEWFADAAEAALGREVRDVEGAGAAGGLGFALLLLKARPLSGASTIARMTGIEASLDGAAALFTARAPTTVRRPLGRASSS
jgi:glycerate kinase